VLESLEDRRLLSVDPLPVPLEPVDPWGGQVYESSLSAEIAAPDETDSFTVDLDDGQMFSVVIDPDAALQPVVELFDPGNNAIGSATAGATGEDALLQHVAATAAGTYTATVGGFSGSAGEYTVQLILGATVETEEHGGAANDDAASAQDLDAAFNELQVDSAQRTAVLGTATGYVASQTQHDNLFYPNLLTFDFTQAPSPAGDAELTISAIGDLDESFEYLTLYGEGVVQDLVFDTDGAQQSPVSTVLSVSRDDLDILAADGTISFAVQPSRDVNNLGSNELTLQLSYPSASVGGDWYRFSLHDGEAATLVLTPSTPLGATLELYDAGGDLLAGGASIDNFLDATTDALPNTYFACVSGSPQSDYSLVITRNAGFDAKRGNDRLSDAQDITPTGTVLGSVVADVAPTTFPDGEDSQPIVFAALGDYGSGSLNERFVADMIKGWDPDFVITTGDNNYGSLDVGSLSWTTNIGTDYGSFILGRSDNRYPEQTSPIQRFFPTVGNHDSDNGGYSGYDGGDITGYLDYFHYDPVAARLPDGVHNADNSYYDFRWGPIHFFAVDSDHAVVDDASLAAQIQWLEAGLTNSTATWKFVFFHHPPFASGPHGSSLPMQWPFRQWGADAVFCGHNHHYERVVVDDMPYFVSGAGGMSLYPFQEPLPGSAVRYHEAFGSMRVSVEESLATFEFLSIADGGYGANGGMVVDTFVIDKWGDTDDYYRLQVNAGDALTIETFTPADGPFEFTNGLDPAIELYDSAGELVAGNDNGADDHRNAKFNHTATSSGSYAVRVLAAAETAGEYVLHVGGYSGALPAFEVAATQPADGETLTDYPPVITVHFNDPILLASLDAFDLRIDETPATSVTVTDGNTATFDLPTGLAHGPHNVGIAAGAILDLQNTPIEPFSATVMIDTAGPRVIESSVLPGSVLAAGELVYTARFDEQLDSADLDQWDIRLYGFRSGYHYPDAFVYDPDTSTLTVEFLTIGPDDYVLALYSGDGGFEDLMGNDLDGEANPATTVPSGDGNPGGDFVVGFSSTPVAVVDRHVFYNHSAFDGNNVLADDEDDDAVATDKVPLLPGHTATVANYTSYSSGINGLMVDVAGLPGVPNAADFAFSVGNDDQPNDWTPAPSPNIVAVRPGKGTGGSDRVTIIWDDYAILNQWLRVEVLSTPNTGLPQADVFYFGNAVGESGNSAADAKVNAIDAIMARNNPRALVDPAPVDFRYDYNRDKRVNATDMLIARENQTHFLNALRLISVPQFKAAVADGAAVAEGTEEAGAVLDDSSWLYALEYAADESSKKETPVEAAVDELWW